MHTFPAPSWWVSLVDDRTQERGARRRLLAEVQASGVEVDEPTLSRALSGKRVQIEVAVAVSQLLGVPPPIFIPTTEAIARAIVAELALRPRR